MNFLISIFLFLMTIIDGCRGILLNDSRVFSSENVNKIVEVAPIANVAMMENRFGWRDKYFYLFGGSVKKTNNQLSYRIIENFQKFIVIQERKETGTFLVSNDRDICILKNLENENELVSIECNEIDKINYVTKKYKVFLNALKVDKTVYFASYLDIEKLNFKKIYKINNYYVYQINSEIDLKKLFKHKSYSNGELPYSLMTSTFTEIFISKDEINNEKRLSEFLFVPGGRYTLNFNEENLNNKIGKIYQFANDDLESFVLGLKDRNERFAIRSFFNFLDQEKYSIFSTKDESTNQMEATSYLVSLNKIKSCIGKFFKKSKREMEVVSKAEIVYFKNPERKKILDQANSYKINIENYSSSFNCDIIHQIVNCSESETSCKYNYY